MAGHDARFPGSLQRIQYTSYARFAMSMFVNVNGTIAPAANAVIPILDHGFLYGEGVYETLRTYGGEPFLFDRHIERLRASARALLLEVPFTDGELLQRSLDTMSAADLGVAADGSVREAYIRILLTRGIGELTYDVAATPVPSLVVIVKPLPVTPEEQYERGVRVVLVDIIRNHPQSVNPLIKSNNLLNNALAMQQAIRRGAVEGVFRNYRGEISECSQSNLFIVKDGRVRTPRCRRACWPASRGPTSSSSVPRWAFRSRTRRSSTTISSPPTRRSSRARRRS